MRPRVTDPRVLALAASAFAIRLMLAWQHFCEGFNTSLSEEIFWGMGRRIAETGQYAYWDLPFPHVLHGPVFPGTIAGTLLLFGERYQYLPMLVLQALLAPLGTLILVRVFATALRRAGIDGVTVRRAFWAALCLLLFSPVALVYDRMLLSECLTTFLLILAFAAWQYSEGNSTPPQRWLSRCAAGLVLGVAVLAKPALSLVPPALFCYYVLVRRDAFRDALVRSVVVAVLMVAVVTPWAYRNYRLLGRIVPVGLNSGLYVWAGTMPMRADGAPIPTPDEEAMRVRFLSAPPHEALQLDEEFAARGRAAILAHPGSWLVKCLRRTGKLWASSHAGAFETLPPAMRLTILGWSLLFALIGWASLVLVLGQRLVALHGYALMPIYITLAHFPILSSARYAIPAWPFLLCLAAYGIAWAASLMEQRRRRMPVAIPA